MEAIETERLIIRRFALDDWKDLYEYLSDKEVIEFEPYDVITEEESKRKAMEWANDPAFWAVCLRQTEKVIGNIYFKQKPPANFLTWEIGFVFNVSYQRQGYATESCRAFIKFAFENMQVRRIIAECNPANERSWKLLERLNMRREGHMIKNVYFKYDSRGNPLWQDTYIYAMLVEDCNRQNIE